MKSIATVVGCFTLTGMLSACATPYVALDIRGAAVDAVTSEPLEGVVVLAQWELFEGGPGHGGKRGRMLGLQEVVTDRDGKFVVPGWGPRIAPPLTYLQDDQPRLLMFLSGYEPLTLHSDFKGPVGPATYESRSSLDGRVFKMKRELGPLADQARALGSFQIGLAWNRENLYWKQYPRMVAAVDREASRIIKELEEANLRGKVLGPETIDSLAGGRKQFEEFLKTEAK